MSTNTIDVGEWVGERWNRLKRTVQNHFDEYDFNRAALAHQISLTLILIIAVTIRLFPLLKGWDPQIKAFDPWMQVRAAKYMLDNGFWEFLLWYDNLSWYPFGRAIGTSLYIAVPLTILLVFKFLTFLGFNITIEFAAFLVPVIFGTLGVFFTYLFAKEAISPRAGLFAALIMAVTPAYVSRSIAGFVDNESVGVLFTVMAFYFFIRALSRDSNFSAILAGISLGLLGSSWGAFRFAYDLLPVYALVIVITGNYTARFLRVYTVTISISTMMMILVPRVGPRFVLDMEGLVPIGMIAFLVLFGILQDMTKVLKPESFRKMIFLSFILLVLVMGGFFVILVLTGNVNRIGEKFISVILPESRNSLPLIDSVSEQLPLAWGSLYANLSTLLFFIPLGIYFALRKPTEKNLFILTFSLFTIYFSGAMIRLMLILAPAAALLTALAIDNLLLPYAYAAHGRIKLTKTTMQLPSIGGQNAAGSYVIVFGLMLIMLTNGVNTAADSYSTPEITPGGSQNDPQTLFDWLEAFDYMKAQTSYLPYSAVGNYEGFKESQPPVIMSWWDYGYYITAGGESISLVDNATSNSTQIGVVGTMLMYNESASINLLYQYNVKYVLVVPAGGLIGLGSDIGKSIWMIRIAEQYTPEYGIVEEDYFNPSGGYVDKWYDSVLYRLMAYRSLGMSGQSGSGAPPFISDDFQGLADDIRENVVTDTVNPLQYFTEVFRSTGLVKQLPGDYPMVRLFRVDYPDDMELRFNEFQQTINRIKANL